MVFSHVLQSQVIGCSWPVTGRALWAASVAEACQAQLYGLTTPVPVTHLSATVFKEVLSGEVSQPVDASQAKQQWAAFRNYLTRHAGGSWSHSWWQAA